MSNVLPSLSGDCTPSRWLAQAELLGERPCGCSPCVKPSHLADFRLRKLRILLLRASYGTKQSGGVGVTHVLDLRYPFQVRHSVIDLLSVLVVYLQSFRRTEECTSHESCNRRGLLGSVSAQVHLQVSICVGARFEDPPGPSAISRRASPNAASIADFVDSSPPVHRLPNFTHPQPNTGRGGQAQLWRAA